MALIPPINSPASPSPQDQINATSLLVNGTSFNAANFQLYGKVNDQLVHDYLAKLDLLNRDVYLYDSQKNHDIDGFVLLGNALIPNTNNATDTFSFCIQDLNSE